MTGRVEKESVIVTIERISLPYTAEKDDDGMMILLVENILRKVNYQRMDFAGMEAITLNQRNK